MAPNIKRMTIGRAARAERKMRTFQTHLPEDIWKRIRLFCVQHDLSLERCATEAFTAWLKERKA